MPIELDSFACTIPGNPGRARANKRLVPVLRNGKPALARRTPAKSWRSSAQLILRAAAAGRLFTGGPLIVSVSTYWHRLHRQGPAKGLAFGDVDAVAKEVLDALEGAGVIKSDAQIIKLELSKLHSAQPRIEVEVRRA